MNLLIALFLIIAEAIYEGLYDDGHKLVAGMLEFTNLKVGAKIFGN